MAFLISGEIGFIYKYEVVLWKTSLNGVVNPTYQATKNNQNNLMLSRKSGGYNLVPAQVQTVIQSKQTKYRKVVDKK